MAQILRSGRGDLDANSYTCPNMNSRGDTER